MFIFLLIISWYVPKNSLATSVPCGCFILGPYLKHEIGGRYSVLVCARRWGGTFTLSYNFLTAF